MDFDTASFLEGLFSGTPGSATVISEVEPAAGSPGTAVPESRADGDDFGSLEPDPFAGWSQRPNHAGRLCWEAPSLPESARWWGGVPSRTCPS